MISVYVGGEGDPLGGMQFYIVDRSEFSGKRGVLHFVDGNTARFDEIKEGTRSPDPTFTLPLDMGHDFLRTMAELAYERGIRLKASEMREGKLEATEKHLEDMRQLVFKEKHV